MNVGIEGKAITRVKGHESRLYEAPQVIVGLFYKFTFCKGERTIIKTHRHPKKKKYFNIFLSIEMAIEAGFPYRQKDHCQYIFHMVNR